MDIEVLEELRAAGDILRFHTSPLRQPQTVGQHTYNVALLVLAIDPDASPALLRAALLHDAPEIMTGDVPSPVKWKHQFLEDALREVEAIMLRRINFPQLTTTEREILKLADHIEGAYFCVEQAERGDTLGLDIARKYLEAATKRAGTTQLYARKLLDRLRQRLQRMQPVRGLNRTEETT